jgi:ATP-binding protein involved in chromosome partitioning
MAPQQNFMKNHSIATLQDSGVALQEIKETLNSFTDPLSGKGLLDSQRVEGVIFHQSRLSFVLNVVPGHLATYEALARELKDHLQQLPGLQDVLIVLTAQRKAGMAAPVSAPHLSSSSQDKKFSEKLNFPQIGKIIAIASGKGGVGKSTVAVNVALSLQLSGLATGLMDADFYGPSVPRMLGLTGRPRLTEHKKLIPLTFRGLKCMSIGFFIDEEVPVVWRGPIVQSSFQQLLKETDWGSLDVLVIDLPPGTGDTHLTLIQKVPLDGVIVVSTPQDIALLDARRAIAMFHRLDTPVLGLVENMGTFTCPHCQQKSAIFHHGGVQAESQKHNLPFLGEIPLHPHIRETMDQGMPIALQPDHPLAQCFQHIAHHIQQTFFPAEQRS